MASVPPSPRRRGFFLSSRFCENSVSWCGVQIDERRNVRSEPPESSHAWPPGPPPTKRASVWNRTADGGDAWPARRLSGRRIPSGDDADQTWMQLSLAPLEMSSALPDRNSRVATAPACAACGRGGGYERGESGVGVY